VNGRCRPKTNGRIQIVNTEARGAAVRIGDTRFHANAITFLEMFDLFSNFNDNASSFVS
jgi:hypothetical protein